MRADLGHEGRRARGVKTFTKHHDAVEPRALKHMTAESLAHETFHAITVNGARH